MIQQIFATIPILPIILVTNQKDLDKSKRVKGYVLPEMGSIIAKAIHIAHETTQENLVIIYYPNMLEEEEFDVFSTLVHESVHAWDFTANHYGYGNDTELRAYALEAMFRQLVEGYGRMKKRKEKRDASRT